MRDQSMAQETFSTAKSSSVSANPRVGDNPVAEFLSKLVNSPDVPRPLNEAGDSSL